MALSPQCQENGMSWASQMLSTVPAGRESLAREAVIVPAAPNSESKPQQELAAPIVWGLLFPR